MITGIIKNNLVSKEQYEITVEVDGHEFTSVYCNSYATGIVSIFCYLTKMQYGLISIITVDKIIDKTGE